MLVEFNEVVARLSPGAFTEFEKRGPVEVNPRHVVSARRVVLEDPDVQSFVSQLRLSDGDYLCVEGSPSEVRAKLNGGAR